MDSSSQRSSSEAPAPATEAHEPRAWLLACAALVLTALAYVAALGGPFIWDDRQLILDSPKVTAARPLSEYFGSPFWLQQEMEPGGRSYYRPLTIISLALDHRLHGMNPGGYHLTNILLHLACTLVLFALLRRRGIAPVGTFALTLAWSLFPRLTEDVAWIAGRTDVLATLFVLTGLFIVSAEPTVREPNEPLSRTLLRNMAAALAMLAGLLAKEVALAGLVALFVLELSPSRARPRAARVAGLLPYVAVSVIYFVLRIRTMGTQLAPDPLQPSERLFAALEAAGRYTSMVLNPWQPELQIGSLRSLDLPFAVAGSLVLISLPVGLWLGRRSLRLAEPWSQALLLLTAVSFGLVSHLVPISVNIVAADRFLYLPLAGAVLLLAPLVRAKKGWSVRFKLATAALLASFTLATALRVNTWADEVGFWLKALHQQGEGNGMARLELGNLYFRAGLPDEALSSWLHAHRLNPDDGMALNNVGIALTSTGQYAEATTVFAETIRRLPNLPVTHLNQALTAVARGRFADAQHGVREALRLYPEYGHARVVLSALPALEKLSQEIEAAPKDLQERLERARHLAELSRSSEAMQSWLNVARDPLATTAMLEEGLTFALRIGDVNSTQSLFQIYERRTQPGPDDPLRVAYAARAEQGLRLRQAWPELGTPLTRAVSSHGPDRAALRTSR